MKRKITALILMLMLVSMLASCGLQVPRPEIKEGRFDFSITYELNGEVKTFSAVYVCEYGGTSWTLEGGHYSRDWKSHTEGDYEGDDYAAIVAKTDDGGDIMIFFGIYAEYFMGDPERGDRGDPEPSIYVTYPENEYDGIRVVAEPEEVEELYGAKIISYEYAEPIQNTFKLFA